MIAAALTGRRLSLTVETAPDETPIAPFLIDPVSAKTGRELSVRYIFTTQGLPLEAGSPDMSEDMMRSFGRANTERADDELTAAEGEALLTAAWLWQTVGGLPSVQAYLASVNNGDAPDVSLGKALPVFMQRAVPLLSRIRHRLESVNLTSSDGTSGTNFPQAGEQPAPVPSPPAPPSTPNPDPAAPTVSGSPLTIS